MRSWMPLMLVAGLALLVAGSAQAEGQEPPVPASETLDPSAVQEDPDAPQASADEMPALEAEDPAVPASEAEPQEEGMAEVGAEEWEAGADPAAPADWSAAEDSTASGQPEGPAPETQPAEVAVPEQAQPELGALDADSQVAPNGVTLGEIGYDSEGRQGRVHLVVRGDTLWDISQAYLGTPWVWPSIWQDNRGIENPHLIYPGDRIWITDGEMRVVTREEAEALLAGQPAALDADPVEEIVEEPPQVAPLMAREPRMQRVSTREKAGFISADAYDAAASILDGVSDKVMLSEGDAVYIGLGAGDVAPGDRFTVFRKQERVFDPDTGRLLGYHVELLGWVEVREPEDEASLALIRESESEIERGDRLVPYQELPHEIAVMPAPEGVEGKVSFFAKSRTMMGMSDFVYLNRGSLDGVEVGSPLEVYRPAYVAREVARGTRVEVPARVIAQLLVVKAEPNTSVAYVTHTHTEIELGDHVRAATR